uniref:Uncharacterized protein n=2 Tax=Cucumis sativus TaxID=3659 RepID=A0A0A0KLC1_CUCSA
MKVNRGLNETTGVVLEYLQDAKEYGQRKGDDILALFILVIGRKMNGNQLVGTIPSKLGNLDKLFEL